MRTSRGWEKLNKQILEKIAEWKKSIIEKEIYEKNIILRKELEIAEREKISDEKHRSLLKNHEEMKLELGKKLQKEKERADILAKKYEDLLEASKNVVEEKEKIERMNKRIVQKFALAEKNSLANKEELKKRTDQIREEFENKLKLIAKQQVDKEIEYRAKIESVTEDLKRYYEELKKYKELYYKREKELKEKFKEILS